jgi:hypothetical protein
MSFSIDPQSFDAGRMGVYIESVLRGCKPVAEITVRKSHLLELEAKLRKMDIYWIVSDGGSCHVKIWIFAHAHLRQIVNKMIGNPFDTSIVEIWMRGKMLGYTEHEIARFIEKVRSGDNGSQVATDDDEVTERHQV